MDCALVAGRGPALGEGVVAVGVIGDLSHTQSGHDAALLVRRGAPEPRWAPRERRALDDFHLKLEKPAHVRLSLQRRAPGNLRRHLWRAMWRFAVLVVADLGAFGLMREAIRAVRERALLGDGLSTGIQRLLPSGSLDGWQFAAALFVSLLLTGSYGPGDRRRDAKRLFVACALATALPLWTMLWTRGFAPVLVQYGVTVMLVWVGILLERLSIDRVIGVVRSPAKDSAPTLFVGPAEECKKVAAGPAFSQDGYHPIGFVDIASPPGTGALGTMQDFPLLLAASGAEAVVVCGELTDGDFRDVVDATLAAGCQLLSAPHALEVAGVEPAFVWRQGQPLVQLTAPSLKGQHLAIKRVVDFVGSLVGLLVAAPVMLVIAAAIKLDSAGPVFFRQERIGRGGRRFQIIKFRTMVNGAEAQREGLLSQSVYPDPRLFKVPRDPRITKLGRFLRRTSLDEIPQLVNVLSGEMSLVGPRPALPSEVELYERHHYARFDVKPGMTGPWQVGGRNDVTDFERVVVLETDYMRNWSLGKDLWILVKTVPVVLTARGAY